MCCVHLMTVLYPRGGTQGYQWQGGANERPTFLTPKKSITQKQDPKKVQQPKIVTPKKSNFSPHAIENGRISFLSTPQKVLAKMFISKNVHQKIDNPKNVPSREFQTPKRSSHLPVTDTPEYPPGTKPSIVSKFVCNLCVQPASCIL